MAEIEFSLSVVSQAAAFRGALRDVEVEVLSGAACAVLAEEMARVEKAAAALRAMAAAKAAACGAHSAAGFTEPEEWLARITGATRHTARAELATGSRLADCPTTRAAVAAGELSLGQADEITRTEREKPGSEEALVERARSATRQQLAEECRTRRQAGADRDALAARQRERRSFRAWVDSDGLQCGLLKLEPVEGVALLSRIQVEADRRHRHARRQGSTERWEAHAADAVAAILASGLGSSPASDETGGRVEGAVAATPVPKARAPRRADVVFVVDLRTFRDGQHENSVCHLIGGGPVPPAVVREVARDAFLKVVFHDGVDIRTVTHLGRYIPAELRTALDLGPPPHFDGVACSVCGNRFGLQWDHVEPVCAGGVTSLANEDAKCWTCHADKTRRERRSGVYDRARRRPERPEPQELDSG